VLIQPNDSASIHVEVKRLSREDALCRMLGAAARERVEKEFNTGKVSRQIEAVYKELF
jgi:glycosyltransferase involved in cell wall biosynthesis